jgi:predicted Zn-dependent peptidase
MKPRKDTLKNGLGVITIPHKDNPAVTVLVMVEAGSKYETKKISGLSHFLEHMCFKGTVKRPKAIDISRELDTIGSQYNAFTGQEFTGYWAKAHPKHLSKLIEVVSDLYLNPTFPAREIEREKGVIVEEINMYEDMPQRHVLDLFMSLLYGDQPAGWNVAGTKETVRKMKRQDFISYRDKNYLANTTTLIVSGNFERRTALGEIEKAFKTLKRERRKNKLPVKERQKEPGILLKKKDTDQTHIVLGVRTFSVLSSKIPALKVLNTVLGGGMSSRLFQKLREEMGVGYYVKSFSDEYTDHGYLSVVAGVDRKRVEEVVQVIIEEFRKLKTDLVPASELRKAKDYLSGNLYLGLETSDAVAEFFGIQEVLKHSLKTPDEMVKEVRKISSSDVKKVAREIFKKSEINLAAIGRDLSRERLKKVLQKL